MEAPLKRARAAGDQTCAQCHLEIHGMTRCCLSIDSNWAAAWSATAANFCSVGRDSTFAECFCSMNMPQKCVLQAIFPSEVEPGFAFMAYAVPAKPGDKFNMFWNFESSEAVGKYISASSLRVRLMKVAPSTGMQLLERVSIFKEFTARFGNPSHDESLVCFANRKGLVLLCTRTGAWVATKPRLCQPEGPSASEPTVQFETISGSLPFFGLETDSIGGNAEQSQDALCCSAGDAVFVSCIREGVCFVSNASVWVYDSCKKSRETEPVSLSDDCVRNGAPNYWFSKFPKGSCPLVVDKTIGILQVSLDSSCHCESRNLAMESVLSMLQYQENISKGHDSCSTSSNAIQLFACSLVPFDGSTTLASIESHAKPQKWRCTNILSYGASSRSDIKFTNGPTGYGVAVACRSQQLSILDVYVHNIFANESPLLLRVPSNIHVTDWDGVNCSKFIFLDSSKNSLYWVDSSSTG